MSSSLDPSWPSKVLRMVRLFSLHFFHTDNREEPEVVDEDVEPVLTFPGLGAVSDIGGRWR